MDTLLDALLRIAAGFIPGRAQFNDPAALYEWNRRIGVILVSTIVTSIFWAICTLGLLPSIFPGFLRAGELKTATDRVEASIASVQQTVAHNAELDRLYRASQLRNAIIDAQTRRCKTKTDEGRQLYARLIDNMLEEYRQIAGADYQVPGCGDL